VGGVVVATKHIAGRDDLHRRRAGQHGANLYRRGVRAQDEATLDIEGVLHVARRVVGRRVEGIEVVPLGLDPGTGAHLEAHAVEDLLDFQPNPRERMQGSRATAAARQGHVQLAFQVGSQASARQIAQSRLHSLFDGGPRSLADSPTAGRSLGLAGPGPSSVRWPCLSCPGSALAPRACPARSKATRSQPRIPRSGARKLRSDPEPLRFLRLHSRRNRSHGQPRTQHQRPARPS